MSRVITGEDDTVLAHLRTVEHITFAGGPTDEWP